MARVPYLDKSDLSESDRHVIESHSVSPDEVLNVHRAVVHNVPVAEARREFSRAVWRESELTDRQRELVILTVACELGSKYEWHQHVTYAIDDLVSATEVRQIAAGETDGFDDVEAALIAYAMRFANMDVDNATHDQLAAFFDETELVAIAMLAMNYLGLAHILDGFDVEIEDDEFVGWDLESL